MKKLLYLLPILFFMIASCDQDAVFDEVEQLNIDIDLIETYLAQNSIEADTLQPSQMRIIVTNEGTGPKAAFGSTVIVDYRGFLLDGTEFDSSIGRGPFSVVIGRSDVIVGWDIGLRELSQGSRATLFIPSSLAYGNVRRGSLIPPNSVLAFEIEVLDIRQ